MYYSKKGGRWTVNEVKAQKKVSLYFGFTETNSNEKAF